MRIGWDCLKLRLNDMCEPRRIAIAGMETPLLVPSFSSASAERVGSMHENLSEHIVDASLVSAYDLYYRRISKKKIWCSDIVFLDSGDYERFQFTGLVKKRRWAPAMYAKVIADLQPLSKLVLVSFDRRASVQDQVAAARRFFDSYPNYASDFILKPPTKRAKQVDMPGLIRNIAGVKGFDILGIPEKELGQSLLQRCKNLLRVRDAMNRNQLHIPIHVFGCLDPLSIISYFLCGADVFDGLAWTKFSFSDDLALYVNNHALLSTSYSQSDMSVKVSAFVLNLNYLTHLMAHMRQFAGNHDFAALELKGDHLERIKALTADAGLEI